MIGIFRTDTDANRTVVTDQAGKKRISKTNALGQLKEVWEILGGSETGSESVSFPDTSIAHGFKTTYSYDTLSNLTTVNQGGQTRTFTYSSLSRLLSATNPESGTISYEYDNNGNLVKKTDARSIETEYTYDALNRVTEREYSDSTPDVEYTYGTAAPKIGKLVKVESSVSTTEYTGFDILGRVTAHKQTTDGQQYTTGYTYSLSGALLEQTYPSGRVVKNTYDTADGSLSQVQSKRTSETYRNFANGFIFNAAGAVTAMRLGNGKWENTVFNSRLQPTMIGLGNGVNSQDLLKLEYSYGTTENNGNVLEQKITVPGVAHPFVQAYSYDSLNRLTNAEETQSSSQTWEQTFTFDRYGNRNFDEANTNFEGFDKLCSGDTELCSDLRKRLNPSINTANNRLSTSDDYAFDSSGNTTSDPDDRTFIYDAENKQIEVKDDQDATIGQYSYDGDGKRIKKYVPGTGETTIFVYDAGGKLIGEYSTIVQTGSNAKTVYTTNDHLGSPRINTDGVGAVISRHDYHPFGEEVTRSGYGSDTICKQFAGYERDGETGLDFAQARYFASSHGRFSSPDPLQASAAPIRPQSWNRYLYSYNNPLRYTDPTGMIAGDFYDEEGRKIGTDGKDDTKKYFVSEKKDREMLRGVKGSYTDKVNSAIELPSFDARQEIGIAAVNRSNSPTADDVKGKFHEEGGVVLDGVAIQAKSGAYSDPLTQDTASIDVTQTNDPSKQASVNQAVNDGSLDTTYHVHPSGQKHKPVPLSASNEVKIGGTIEGPREYGQGPSPGDRAFAGAVNTKLGYHIVVAARDRQIHFYNSGGSFATMPLQSFVRIK